MKKTKPIYNNQVHTAIDNQVVNTLNYLETWVGKSVKAKRNMETYGGERISAGQILTVKDYGNHLCAPYIKLIGFKGMYPHYKFDLL